MGRLKRLLSPGVIVAVVAMVFALGGTAVADHLLDGDDIARNSLTGLHIENESLRGGDLADGAITSRQLNPFTFRALSREGERGPAGPAGPAGAQGPAGAAGADGADGADGASALDPVPSGQTIRGAIGADDHAHDVDASDFGIDVSMPMPAANPLGDADVTVNVDHWQDGGGQLPPTSADGPGGCNGTLDNPTAPAGHVCIYVAGSDLAQNLEGYSVRFGAEESPYGFKLKWDASAEGDTFVDAVWAYTAP